MKKKERIKLLQTSCKACGKGVDVWESTCPGCKATLLPEGNPEEGEKVGRLVKTLEEKLQILTNEAPEKGKPYRRTDEVNVAAKALGPFREKYGLGPYLSAARKTALPFLISVQKSTLQANVILLVVLALFPLLPLVMGWDLTMISLMLMPVIFSALMCLKVWMDLNKLRQEAQS